MHIKLKVEFDCGLVGQGLMADIEAAHGHSNDGDTGPETLTCIWLNPADSLITDVVEKFSEEDAMLEVHLTKEE